MPRLVWLIVGGGAAAMNAVKALRVLPSNDGPPYVLMISSVVLAACFLTFLFLGMKQQVTLVDSVLTVRNGLGQRRQARLDQIVALLASSRAMGFLARDERGKFRRVGFLSDSLLKSPSRDAILAFVNEQFVLGKRSVPGDFMFLARTFPRWSPATSIWTCLMIGSVPTFFAAVSAVNNREGFLMTLLIPPGVLALYPLFLALNILRRRRLMGEGRFEKLGWIPRKP